jgi:hypothetical protein
MTNEEHRSVPTSLVQEADVDGQILVTTAAHFKTLVLPFEFIAGIKVGNALLFCVEHASFQLTLHGPVRHKARYARARQDQVR